MKTWIWPRIVNSDKKRMVALQAFEENSMASSDAEGNVHWYYRADGKDQGPVLLSRLRQMAHQGRLTTEDLVRKGKTGEWGPAGGFPEIEVHSIRAIAPREFVEAPPVSEIPPVRVNRFGEFVDSVREGISDRLFVLWSEIRSRTNLICKILGYFALAVAGTCLVFVAVESKLFRWPKVLDPEETCRSLWEELRQLREHGTATSSWNEFAERGRMTLLPIIKRLEQEASSDNRKAQLLLWANRDCLLKMFDNARTEPSQSESLLAEYLENVDRLKAGDDIYVRDSRDIVRFGFQKKKANVKSWLADPTTASLAVFLSLLNLTLLGRFVWRLARRKAIS
jgi:hypothetical protein